MACELVLALDLQHEKQARDLQASLQGLPIIYKIGLEALFTYGVKFASDLTESNERVFVDAKLYDIPRTVEAASKALAATTGAEFVTAYAHPGVIKAARAGLDERAQATTQATIKRGKKPKLLAVTVLTSVDAGALSKWGHSKSLDDLVMLRAELALAEGADGIVASPHELPRLRKAFPDAIMMMPGIRPAADLPGTGRLPSDDQKRTASPKEAKDMGADYIVVGRPIVSSPNPKAAAEQILQDIA